MNILIIPSWYPSVANPLSGSFFREQAIALQKSGHRVIVLNVTYSNRRSFFSKDNFHLKKSDDEGLIVYSYVTPSFGLFRVKKLLVKNFLKRIKKVFRRIIEDGEHIDLIHAHAYMPAGYCATELGELYNIPVVVTEHSSSLINRSLTPIEIHYLKMCIESSAKFICVGEALKAKIIQITGTDYNIEVIPNMVSSLFKYKERDKCNNKFVFCSVGNLVEGKRFENTIKAFAKAFKGNVNVKLKIIGGGPLFNSLKQQIEYLKMDDQIILLGETSREGVAFQMQESDVFILPSAYETFGIVYIEALACGKPVIATRNGGAEWIINDNNGVLIEVDNEEQLVESMLTMVRNHQRYENEQISRDTFEKFGEEVVNDRITSLYEICMKK
jgi:L-malate glycosyltransferase